MTQQTRIGFIGARGHVGLAFDGLRRLPRETWRIAAICGGTAEEPADALARESALLGAEPARFTDWRRMLDEAPLDAVVVCGPFEAHAAMTVSALQHGLDVFCEKPVACTHDDHVSLAAALAAHPGRVVVPMLSLRTEPAFATAHARVAAGAVGEVRLINAQKAYRLGRREAYYHQRATSAGTIPWVGVHAIDWVSWFSGQAFVSVDARHTRRGNRGHGDLEAGALLLFELTQEVFASVSLDYLRPDGAPTHGDDRVRVVGTHGVIEVRDGQCYLINDETGGERRCALQPESSLFAAFLRAVRGEGESPVSAASLLAVSRACLLARDSADRREPVRFTA